MHTATLRAAGGSISVTIPQPMAKAFGLRAGEQVSFEADGGRLVISPIGRRKYSLDDLLAMQGGEPLMVDAEWDAMPTVGREGAL